MAKLGYTSSCSALDYIIAFSFLFTTTPCIDNMEVWHYECGVTLHGKLHIDQEEMCINSVKQSGSPMCIVEDTCHVA